MRLIRPPRPTGTPPKLGGVRGGLNEGILYQSRDHSLAFDLFQSGEITYEEMLNFAQKNVVTRAMTPGEDNRMRPDIIHITDILPDDYFYMCSDGMLEQMDNNQLVSLLSSKLTDEDKRDQFVKLTKDNQDNHSAWILHIKDIIKDEGDDQLENEEPNSRYNAINTLPHIDEKNDDVVVVEQSKQSIFQKIIAYFK